MSLTAQGPQFVPLLTEETIEPYLSTSFGSVTGTAVNESGDLAFTSGTGSALFLRSAGSDSPVRILQAGDEVSEFPGARVASVSAPFINASGLVAFTAGLNLPTGAARTVLYSYDWDGRHLIAEDALGLISILALNDAGTVAYRSSTSTASVYLVRQDGVRQRLVGTGDPAPGTTGVFTTAFSTTGAALNPADELLFRATLSTGAAGYFVAGPAGIRKVAATGDSLPGGAGVITTLLSPVTWKDAETVAFPANSAIWLSSLTGLTRFVGVGDPAPPGMSGTIQTINLLLGNQAGGLLMAIAANSRRGLVRFGQGAPSLMVLEPLSGAAGVLFGNLTGPSVPVLAPTVVMNSAGEVAFLGNQRNSTGVLTFGIFGSVGGGTAFAIALNGGPSPIPGEAYWIAGVSYVSSLAPVSGAGIVFTTRLQNGSTEAGTFRAWLGGGEALVTTADPLPAGARTLIPSVSGAGDFVSFSARRGGGQQSLGIHRIATQETSIVVTEGDPAPSSGAARFLTLGSFHINVTGSLAFASSLGGGTAPSGVYLGSLDEPLRKLALEGEPVLGTVGAGVLTLPALGALTDSGTVLISAGSNFFLSTPQGTLQKIVAVNDPLPGGGTYALGTGFFFSQRAVMGSGGHVGFTSSNGVYLKPPDGPMVAVARVGSAAPSGTFTAFTLPFSPRMNSVGRFPFMASFTQAGLTRIGLFEGDAGGWTLVATAGDPAPGGGTFQITISGPLTFSWAAQSNDLNDLVFSTLFAGSGGTYIRRGTGGTIQAAALVGQPAPGSSGPFASLSTPYLSDAGDVALVGSAPPVGESSWSGLGAWHLTPDNILKDILVRGTIAPEFGGGAIVSNSWSPTWNSDRRYAVSGTISGGTFLSGVFLYVPQVATPTPTGAGVPVTPVDAVTGAAPVSLTFDNVTMAGETSLTIAAGGPTVPSAFAIGNPPVFYNLETTAQFAGMITVCIDTAGTTFPDGNLRLLHHTGGAWVDITTTVTGTVVCGRTASLSPFTVAALPNRPPTAAAGSNQVLESGAGGATFTLNGSASSDPDGDTLAHVWREGLTVIANTAVTSVTRPVGTYVFTLTVTDTHGLSADASVQVIVRDTTAPVMTVPSALEQLSPGAVGVAVSFTANAVDLVDGVVATSCQPASGSVFPVGNTTVTCTATDTAQNPATKSFTVTISQGEDGKMTGRGHFEKNGTHHFFGFRAAQRDLSDTGRFQYFTMAGADPAALAATASGDGNDEASYNRVPLAVTGRFEAVTLSVFFNESAEGLTAAGHRLLDRAVVVAAGTWNGLAGYSFEAIATDVGEPGATRDTFSVVIKGPSGSVVSQASGVLDLGNINSSRVKR